MVGRKAALETPVNEHETKVNNMALENLQPGDMVFAATDIYNDGSLDLPEDTLFARTGARGVLINTGHLEQQPSQVLFLVRFEDANNELGPPVGCWPEELSEEPIGIC
jgi:nitrogen fixation protein NifZ